MQCPTMMQHGWCGDCYVAVTRDGCRSCLSVCRRRERVMFADVRGFMKKPAKSGAGVPLEHAKVDDPMAKTHPQLWEHLSAETWDDGSPRITTTLFVFMEGFRWKCMLKDRYANCVAFHTAHTLSELLEGLEERLGNGTIDWRADRKPSGRRQ